MYPYNEIRRHIMNENSINALKDYLNSKYVSNWLASSVISNYGYYFIDSFSSDFDNTCKDLGLEDQNIEYLIFCDGELEEAIQFGDHLRNSKTYQFCIGLTNLFNDYDEIMKLVRAENLQVYYDIKTA